MMRSYVLILSLLGAAAGWEMCYSVDECYSDSYPYSGTAGRPFPIMPVPVNVQYFLYNKDCLDHPKELYLSDTSSFFSCTFIGKTAFVIHGYTQSAMEPWVMNMCQALVNQGYANCIAVDWSSVSLALYAQAAALVCYIGRQVAKVLYLMEDLFYYSASNVHIIGHSLGAQIAGCAGKFKNPGRITGLDPAGLFFEGEDEAVRLCKADAKFVDVIHTQGKDLMNMGLGYQKPIGHVDFYPNGGQVMPECSNEASNQILAICLLTSIAGPLNCSESFQAVFAPCTEMLKNVTLTMEQLKVIFYSGFCSHFQAVNYYFESITKPKKYVAYPCQSLENCQQGRSEPCPKKGCQSMGHYARPPTSTEPQIYTLTTM